MAEEIGVNLYLDSGTWGPKAFIRRPSNVVIDGGTLMMSSPQTPLGYGVAVKPGEEFTVGIDVKADKEYTQNGSPGVFLIDFLNSNNNRITYTPVSGTVKTKWQRITHTFVVPDDENIKTANVGIRCNQSIPTYFRCLKVERGGVPTEWSPAPEDPKPMVIARSDEITVVRVNDGAKGDTGATGKGVKAITPQYYLSTSNTSCTGGTWQNTEPEYVSGKFYWTRSKIDWTDGKTTYTSAVLAEGVNNANQSAQNANETANDAQSTANDAQNTANNAAADAEAAQSAAENAQNTADKAQQTADDANTTANNAQQTALEAQAASDRANELASGATAGLQQISQVFYADSTGAHVKAANDNETVIQSDGMHVMVGDEEVARFTRDDSHVDNLAVGRFLMFGAHRAEIYEEDGEVGTGFFWVGDVQ